MPQDLSENRVEYKIGVLGKDCMLKEELRIKGRGEQMFPEGLLCILPNDKE